MRLTERKARAVWEERLLEKGLSPRTLKTYRRLFSVLARFLSSRHGPLWDWRELEREDGVAYLAWLAETGWANGTRRLCLKAGRWVVTLLWKRKYLLGDPWRGLSLPYTKNLARPCLEEAEVVSFLESIEGVSFLDARDRALFELMYSSGLRPAEAGRVRREDIDVKSRMLMIRQSKFGKDRIVPVTETAMRHLVSLMEEREGAYLFGAQVKRPLSPNTVARRFSLRLKAAGLEREGITAHTLRHSCARHLLAHGADIRYVQKLLGHESIETTVVYTHEQTEQLKKTYRRYHPREGILYREVDERYLARIEELRKRLEPLMERRLTRRPKTSGEEGGKPR